MSNASIWLPKGEKGEPGDKGPTGDQGPMGDKGPTGDPGPGAEALEEFKSLLESNEGAASIGAEVPNGVLPQKVQAYLDYLNDQISAIEPGNGSAFAALLPKNALAYAISSSSNITNYPATAINTAADNILNNAGGGWLTALDAVAPTVTVAVPFGVVIGDSIAEGHPALHGRLHPDGSAGFNPTAPSSPGQLNYELSRLTNTHWYNHGIGSQTSSQILERSDRDLLGLISDPGDGRGNKTLPGKPFAALVVVGSNDVATDVPEATIKANLLALLDKMKANKIVPIFCNIAQSTTYTTSQRVVLNSINAWMATELKEAGAYVFDLYSWGAASATTLKTTRIVDDIHPNKMGYALLAHDIYDAVPVGLTVESLLIEFKADVTNPPASWAVPTSIGVSRESNSVIISPIGDKVVVDTTKLPALQSPDLVISLRTPITGNSGINKITAKFSKIPNTEVGSGSSSSGNVVVAGTIQKTSSGWVIPGDFSQKGLTGTISANSDGVTIGTTSCATPVVGLVGKAQLSSSNKVTCSYGSSPVTSLTIRFSNGSAEVDPTGSGVPVGTYVNIMAVAP